MRSSPKREFAQAIGGHRTTPHAIPSSDHELRIVWRRAEDYGYPYGRIVRLLILTGQRRGEIAALRRSWIEGDEITFPPGFAKNKREHFTPIGPLAQEIIEALLEGTDLLFPSRLSEETLQRLAKG